MGEGIIGLNGQEITAEQRSIDNIKQSILVIENFFFAMKDVCIPLKFSEQTIAGMEFLKKMHDQLIAQLGPEELEKLKQSVNSKTQTVTNGASNATVA